MIVSMMISRPYRGNAALAHSVPLKPHGADIKESPGRAQAMRPDPPREATGRDLS
jgi:hypothetical protein